ncbi:MAG: ABC transporter permease [Methanoregula sp.]|jgi:putative ABC transport system permease protein|nr:ABC transporter permease [Methanoregula sp.]
MIAKEVDFIKMSARQLYTKRLRVALTVIGIAIGVAAVIGIVALSDGIRYQAIETIKAQSDLTLIEVHPKTMNGVTQLITESKVEALRAAPHVLAVAPAFTDAYSTKKQTFLQVVAVQGGEIDKVLNLKYTSGRAGVPEASEVVFGADLKDKLQRNEGIRVGDVFMALVRDYDANGMPVDRQVPLTVIGALGDRDDKFDNYVLIDQTTASRIRGEQKGYDTVFVRVDDPDAVFNVVDQITDQGLTATGAFEQIKAVNQFMDAILIIFMIFAVFALFVGGLMITTTMITSVYERTREIGITMAVGASENDVIRMVLYECLLIGIIGGIVGNILGYLFTVVLNTVGKPFIIARMGSEFSSIFGNEIAKLSPEMVIAGMAIAVIFSLGAGLYPAIKATHLNPVEAIRGVL